MSDYPSLAEVIRHHNFQITGESDQPMCCECQEGCSGPDGWMLTMEPLDHPAHVADAWREACTIRTVEQLDGLPEHSIVRAGTNGHAYEKSMLFTLVGRRWMEAGNGSPERSDDIGLPALLIFHPDWSKP